MKIIKVGLDPKKQTQTQQSYDYTTGVVAVTVQQYWNVVFDTPVSDPTVCYGATDGTNTVPIIGQLYGTGPYAQIQAARILPMLDTASAGRAYKVQVDYSTLPQPTQAGEMEHHPGNRRGAGHRADRIRRRRHAHPEFSQTAVFQPADPHLLRSRVSSRLPDRHAGLVRGR
jgi:hypothetical protein